MRMTQITGHGGDTEPQYDQNVNNSWGRILWETIYRNANSRGGEVDGGMFRQPIPPVTISSAYLVCPTRLGIVAVARGKPKRLPKISL